MGWRLKLVAILALMILVGGCAWLSYAVYARYQGNDYNVALAASFNAAALVNGEETYSSSDSAVISAYEGKRYVVLPDNYKAIVSLLRKDNAMPMFRRVGKDAPLSIAICDSAALRIEPDGNGDDEALIEFTDDAGKRYTMHVRGGNIWKQIVEYATVGHGEHRNIAL